MVSHIKYWLKTSRILTPEVCSLEVFENFNKTSHQKTLFGPFFLWGNQDVEVNPAYIKVFNVYISGQQCFFPPFAEKWPKFSPFWFSFSPFLNFKGQNFPPYFSKFSSKIGKMQKKWENGQNVPSFFFIFPLFKIQGGNCPSFSKRKKKHCWIEFLQFNFLYTQLKKTYVAKSNILQIYYMKGRFSVMLANLMYFVRVNVKQFLKF